MTETAKAVIDRLQGEAGYATGGYVDRLVFSGLDVHEMLNEIEQAIYTDENKAVEALESIKKDIHRNLTLDYNNNGWAISMGKRLEKEIDNALAEIGGEDE